MNPQESSDCIFQGSLQQAVKGGLTESRLEPILNHLAQCPDCQARYEELLQEDVQRLVGDKQADLNTDPHVAEALDRTRAANDWIVHPDQKEGRFRIIRKIGQGGMGEIYECFDTKLNRIVALKKLRPDRLTPQLLGRLKQEATIQAGLNHPNIVQIYEVGLLGGIPFLAMEYIDGGTLSELLNDRPLAPLEAARLTAQIAEAMHQAHQAGVLHRDLKPSNILIKPSPDPKKYAFQPKIADFGLAKFIGESNDLSDTAIIVGTPAYLSPEQAANKSGEVGPLSDIHSLGVILYECLTGHPPFNANQSGLLLEMIKYLDPISPRKLVPGIGKDLETICLKCLAKEPARRYPNAQALADDLNRFMLGRPIMARPAGRLETAWRWSLRNRRLAASLATILSMVLLFSGYAVWSANYQKYLRRQAEMESNRASLSEASVRVQRDVAFGYLQDELMNLQKIIVKLDNPRIRLANEPEVQLIQTQIQETIEQLAQEVVNDDRILEERPEIVLAALNTQVMTNRIVGRKEEMLQAADRILDVLPSAGRLTTGLARECINSVNLLTNEEVGKGDFARAFEAWERLRGWFCDDRQSFLRKDEPVIASYKMTMMSYIHFLRRVSHQEKAAELESELDRITKH